MGKALMIFSSGSATPSGNEINLFGSAEGGNATEANTQYSATEGADFTNLSFYVISGGSGTNTIQFRKAGANGTNVSAKAGTGLSAEDTTHTDTLAAADLFNLACTDTGTDPVHAYVRANVKFASGHGNFHGCAAFTPVIYDLASTTSYVPISGKLVADGTTIIANVQWKNRGYTSIEAFQVRVTANARLNDSVFRVNVNGSAVGTAITYATTVTGLQTVTGMGISLADGDLVCIQCALLTGVEDLTVAFVGITLKSTLNASETMAMKADGVARTASATPTYYTPGGNLTAITTDAVARAKVGFNCSLRNLRCYVSANTYTGDCTLKCFVNGTARLSKTITAGATGWQEDTTNVWEISATDEISFELVNGTANSITIRSMGVTFSPAQMAYAETVDANDVHVGLMNPFRDSISQAVDVTDSSDAISRFPVSIIQSVDVADAYLATMGAFQAAISQSVVLTDAYERFLTAQAAISQGVDVEDIIVSRHLIADSRNESFVLTSVVDRALLLSGAFLSSVTLSSAASTGLRLSVSNSETTILTGLFDTLLRIAASRSEAVTLATALSTGIRVSTNISAALTLSSASSIFLRMSAAYDQAVATSGVIDNRLIAQANFAINTVLATTLANALSSQLSISESVDLSDAQSTGLRVSVNVAEQLTSVVTSGVEQILQALQDENVTVLFENRSDALISVELSFPLTIAEETAASLVDQEYEESVFLVVRVGAGLITATLATDIPEWDSDTAETSWDVPSSKTSKAWNATRDSKTWEA